MSLIDQIRKILSNHYNFITWSGDTDSFIIEQDGKEYRITVTEEPSKYEKMYISYDYQQNAKAWPFNKTTVQNAFSLLKDDAGMILKVKNKEYYYESMTDFNEGYLTCQTNDGHKYLIPFEEALIELTRSIF